MAIKTFVRYMKPPDGTSGTFDEEKQKWTGMFGQVVYGVTSSFKSH